jgi:hypothetical protein
MTTAGKLRGVVLASTAAMMFLGMGGRTMRAQDTNPTLGDRGGVRGGGTPVQVVVKLDGTPVAGVTVTFKATKSVTATTDSNGVASVSLVPGKYAVTATNDSGTAKKTVTVPKSTTTTIVSLTLAPAATPAPAAAPAVAAPKTP